MERPRLFSWISSPQSFVLASLILLLPLLTLFMGRLQFDYNLNHILGRQPTKDLDRRVDSIFNHSVNPEVALVEDAGDAKQLAIGIRLIQHKYQQRTEGSTIKAVLSLDDFVPQDQQERLRSIAQIKQLFTPSVLQNLVPEERQSYEQLKSMLHPKPFSLQEVPDSIQRMFRDREGKTGRMVLIFPNFDMQQADKFMQFVEEIREARCVDCVGTFYASGESSVYYEIVKMLFREGKYVIGLALFMILGSLLINFRSLGKALLVFSPLAIGMLATLGWMGLSGLSFNIINLAALPIILGTADDYAIHLYQRYLGHPERSLGQTYFLSAFPILGSALTTLIGFGSLLIGNMGGVRTFGLLSVVGILLCTLTTLFWFPALLTFRLGKKSPLPSPSAEIALVEENE